MKSCSTDLATHIAQGQTSLTTVLVIKRTDGVIIAVTEHDEDLLFDASARAALLSNNLIALGGIDVTAHAYAGFTRFNLNDKDNLETSNLQLDGMIDSEIFTRADIKAQRFDYADYQVFAVNWQDLTQGEIRGATGRTGTWTIKESGFSTTFYGLAKQLDDLGGEIIAPTCRVDFGSPRCAPGGALDDGTTIDSLMQSAVVASTDGSRVLTVEAATAASGGDLTAAVLNAGGSGYAPGDTGTIQLGNGDAAYEIDTVDGGGAVLTFHITAAGSGYTTGTNVGTTTTSGAGDGLFTVDTTAAAIVPATGIVDLGRPLDGGLLTWTGGNNAGLSIEAKYVDITAGEITLYLPTFLAIQVGDTFRLLPPCDKTIGRCIGYKNAVNFQGEPYVPGSDWELNYPDFHAPHP